MRIAIVVERFEAGAGGIEDVAWQAAHGLAAEGEDVTVICRVAGPGASVPLQALGTTRAWQPLRVRLFDRASRRAVADGGFDVVHSMTRTTQQDLYFAGGGSHLDYMQRQYSRPGRILRHASPRHRTLLAIERRVFADTRQLVHCNSEMVARQLHLRFGVAHERLAVVHNGVDVERYRPGAHGDAAARLRDSLPGAGPLWVFAGSGFPRKGLDTALGALARTQSEARLFVMGGDEPGPWQQRAAALGLADRVHFLGFRRDPEVVYAAADGLLLPTRYDSFSTVCLEAAASGLPVVTSGSNGACEFIRDGGAGLCVDDPEDVAGFARALDRLADPVERKACGERGRALAETTSWPAHVAKLRALYRRVVDMREARRGRA